MGTSTAVGEELLAAGTSVRIAVQAIVIPTESANVIADTRSGRTDRTVVVGAHLDSVTEGSGINDNGSGSATVLEVAKQLSTLGVKPVNRVRFAWWGGEEFGLLGAEHYVSNLSARELKDIALNLNFDMVGSPNFVRFVYEGDGSATGTKGPVGLGEHRAGVQRLLRLAGARDGADRVRRPGPITGRSSTAASPPAASSPGPRRSRRPRRRRSTGNRRHRPRPVLPRGL